MYKFKRLHMNTEEKEKETEYFEKVNQGWKCTSELLNEEYIDEKHNCLTYGCTYVVMTGSFTRYGMCRDCGDHYIIARYDRYDRIEKDTLNITFDVEDR